MAKHGNDNSGNDKKPLIVFSRYSPYMAVDVEKLESAEGKDLQLQAVTSLCRCGGSCQKPYCDGTHSKIGFEGTPGEHRPPRKSKAYVGKNITIHDNRSICAHAAECINCLPKVFDPCKKPWINPDGADAEAIIAVIERCPSGALSYTINDEHHVDWGNSKSVIKVTKGGPLCCDGGIIIKDADQTVPQAESHYTLCRCGKSANKPFCDGAHLDEKFD
ncbi:MAG: (4Fe-4S)-binding protein [Acidaminococcaceae bacterium]